MDPFSVTATVVGLAGAGIKLATTMYTYAETVYNADKSVRDVAMDVSLTSSALKELGDFLQEQQKHNLVSKNAFATAKEAMKGCEEVFSEIDTALQGSVKRGVESKILNIRGKLKWPLAEKRMEYLRTNLGRLKSSISLLLSVLTLARDVQSQNADKTLIAFQQMQIQRLLEVKQRQDMTFASLQTISLNVYPQHAYEVQNETTLVTTSAPFNAVKSLATPQTSVSSPSEMNGISSQLTQLLIDCETRITTLRSMFEVHRNTLSTNSAFLYHCSDRMVALSRSLHLTAQYSRPPAQRVFGDKTGPPPAYSDEEFVNLTSRSSYASAEPSFRSRYTPSSHARPPYQVTESSPMTSAAFDSSSESLGPATGSPPYDKMPSRMPQVDEIPAILPHRFRDSAAQFPRAYQAPSRAVRLPPPPPEGSTTLTKANTLSYTEDLRSSRTYESVPARYIRRSVSSDDDSDSESGMKDSRRAEGDPRIETEVPRTRNVPVQTDSKTSEDETLSTSSHPSLREMDSYDAGSSGAEFMRLLESYTLLGEEDVAFIREAVKDS